MREPRIVVCMKVVPKPEEIRVNPQTHLLERANVRTEINPPDMNAIELALSLHNEYGGTIDILSMGPPSFETDLRVGLAMGADHLYLLSDRAFGGADTLATTYTLAQGIRKVGAVDVIVLGEESSDGATGQVPQGLAEWLDLPQLTLLTDLSLAQMSQLICLYPRLEPQDIVFSQLPAETMVASSIYSPQQKDTTFILKPDFSAIRQVLDQFEAGTWP